MSRSRWVQAVAMTVVLGLLVAGLIWVRNDDRPDTTATPDPTATASASATPAGPAVYSDNALGADEFVALQADGRLVGVSATTGRVTRVLAEFDRPTTESGIGISHDRGAVYASPVTARRVQACADEPALTMVQLGEVPLQEEVGRGLTPTLSPDGTRLAYRSRCGDDEGVERVVIRVLDSGREFLAYNRPAAGEPDPWTVGDFTWHADSRQLWVAMRRTEGAELRLLDPSKHASLMEAGRVTTEHATYGLERDGDALVFRHACCPPDFREPSRLIRRTLDGTETELVRAAGADRLTGQQTGPRGALLYVRAGQLYRRAAGGQESDLGRATAVARDW